jgi:hypothetical protein
MSLWMPSDDRDRAIHQRLLDQLTIATTTFMANQREGHPAAPEIIQAMKGILGLQFFIVDGLDRYDARPGQRNEP